MIARFAEQADTHFATKAAWQACLKRLAIVSRAPADAATALIQDPVRVATEGAVWGSVKAHGLLPETVILSDDAGQIRIFPGDELLIPANKNIVLALGEVRSTGVLAIPDDQPLTLTHAYALVGGATPDGDKKNVSIVRRTPSGAATLLSINMEDVLKGKNGVTDITLQPDDILFIQTRSRPKSVGEILGSLGSLGFLAQSARYLTGH